MIAARNNQILPFYNPYTLASVGCVLMGILYFHLNTERDQSGFSWLAILALMQVTPFVVAVTRKHFNYIAFIMFNHFVTFSFAKYNQVTTLNNLQALFPETIVAIKELITCTIIMCSAYYLSRLLLFHEFAEKQKFQVLQMTPRMMVFMSLYVITVPVTIYKLPGYFLVIHFALSTADTLLLQCAECPGHKSLSRFFKLTVPISCFWYFIETGFLSMCGQYGGFLFVTTCLKRKYRDFVWLGVLTIFISIFQSVKGEYREFLHSEDNAAKAYADKFAVLGQLLVNKYIIGLPPVVQEDDSEEDEAQNDTTRNIAGGFDRIGDDSLERVLAMTPRVVPFWNGETYESIPYMFIPRTLWPEKPSRAFWNKFGRLYGVLSSDDYQTSVGVGYFAEAYINFGFTGMYLCAVFMGLLVAAVERMSFYFLKGYFYFTYLAFLMPLIGFGADMGTMLNSLFVLTTALVLVRNLLVRMARRDEYS